MAPHLTPSSQPLPAVQQTAPTNRLRSIIGYWGVVAAWMLVIAMLSGEPFSAQNTNRYIDPVLRYFFPQLTPAGFVLAHSVIRKSAHFVEFFILGCLAFWASRRGRAPGWRARWTLQALGVAVAYSLVDEFRQSFVPNRTPSLADSAVDSLGAIVSQGLIYLRHWRRLRSRIPVERI